MLKHCRHLKQKSNDSYCRERCCHNRGGLHIAHTVGKSLFNAEVDAVLASDCGQLAIDPSLCKICETWVEEDCDGLTRFDMHTLEAKQELQWHSILACTW